MNGIWFSASSILSLMLVLLGPVAQDPLKNGQNVFSHRAHVSLDIPCQTCHVKADASDLASDSLLPDASRCLKCHETQKASAKPPAPPLGRTVLPARNLLFSHRKHLQLGNVAPALMAAIDGRTYLGFVSPKMRDQLQSENLCEACHRGLLDEAAKATPHLPAMADCLVCHPRIDPPFSCELCHTKTAYLKPASHTQNFIDIHSSRISHLDKLSCRICHGVGFRCMGCH
jgi:hypothetical protein